MDAANERYIPHLPPQHHQPASSPSCITRSLRLPLPATFFPFFSFPLAVFFYLALRLLLSPPLSSPFVYHFPSLFLPLFSPSLCLFLSPLLSFFSPLSLRSLPLSHSTAFCPFFSSSFPNILFSLSPIFSSFSFFPPDFPKRFPSFLSLVLLVSSFNANVPNTSKSHNAIWLTSFLWVFLYLSCFSVRHSLVFICCPLFKVDIPPHTQFFSSLLFFCLLLSFVFFSFVFSSLLFCFLFFCFIFLSRFLFFFFTFVFLSFVYLSSFL